VCDESDRNWFANMSTTRRGMVSKRVALFAALVATALSANDTRVLAACQEKTGSPSKIELQERVFTEHSDSWEINVKFPVLKGDEAFNKAVHQSVTSAVDDFKKGMPKTATESDPDYGTYLHGTYKAEVLQNGVISVLFNYDEYSSGAAHPWGVLRSIVYDTKGHGTVSLADLFQPGTGFVQRLSELAVESLEQNEYADRHAIHQGAGPVESNFKVFTLTESELVLHFQQYQVAAGAAGEQEVSIPLTSLSRVLRNQWIKVEITFDRDKQVSGVIGSSTDTVKAVDRPYLEYPIKDDCSSHAGAYEQKARRAPEPTCGRITTRPECRSASTKQLRVFVCQFEAARTSSALDTRNGIAYSRSSIYRVSSKDISISHAQTKT